VKTIIINLLLLLLLWVFCSNVLSAEFNVNSTIDAVDSNPGDGLCETAQGNAICTLRGAIQEANALLGKDVINVPADVYTLTLTGVEDFRTYDDSILDLDITDNLDLIGAGRDTTIIEAGATRGALGSKVFAIQGLTTVFMTEITVRHGFITESRGAGIQNSGHLTITNCHIRDNTADNNSDGGGIGSTNGRTFVNNCTFSGNEALAGGAGGGAYGGTFRNSQFVNNTAGEGGGVYGGYIENCHFENNTAGGGGGVSTRGWILNSVFINNNATRGGAIYSSIGSPIIENTRILNNTATARGGGMYFDNTNRVVVLNSLISGNSASTGGAIHSEQGAVNVNNTTITNNSSSNQGGGIFNGMNAQFYVHSSTIYNNVAVSGNNIFIPPVPNANVYIKNSLVGHSNTSSSCAGNAIISQGNNLETADTCGFNLPTDLPNTDPQLSELADNGGPTMTFMPSANSPVIDAGDVSGCQNSFSERFTTSYEPAEIDQRGATRSVDGTNDGNSVCDIGAVEFVPPTVNLAPFAKAGDDIIVSPNSTVNLSAVQSYDFDGNLDSYLWTQTAGATVNLNNADTINSWFTAPDASGTLTFELAVTDNDLAEAQDTVDVIVNRPPIANAGDDIYIPAGETGYFSAALSTDDGTIVSYEWDFLWGYIPGTINDRTGINPSIPGASNVISGASNVYRLKVTDDHGFTDTDMVVAHVIQIEGNIPPVANPGEDITVLPGAVLELDGTGSTDSDGSVTTYHWSNIYGIKIREPESSVIRVVMPEAEGRYKIDLFVEDNEGLAGADTITITVSNQTNQLPNAAIIAPARANIGDTVTLDSSGSVDVGGNIITYEWSQISGDSVSLNTVGNNSEFIVPDTNTALVFQLRVTDNEGGQDTTTHELNVNQRPVAVAGDDVSVESGVLVNLNASGSQDDDGTIQSYSWSQQSGPAIIIQNSNSSNASFSALNIEGEIVIVLTVTDNEGASSTDTILVTVTANNDSNTPPSQTPDPSTNSNSQNSGGGGAMGLELLLTLVMVLRLKAYRGWKRSPPT
jgi:CSLREA domain-containing protein